ncbi:hypothetical protein DRO58_05065 [Candidatus Bathyarchaeota archaeon]|nr:MAG: hypothetical protein DRO58_05065 [Candidatus Bathyarchaeota archaeon]
MGSWASRIIPLISMCLGLFLVGLGLYPSTTPHVLAIGILGASSSALTMRYPKLFKPVAMAASILYVVVFLFLASVPGDILITALAYTLSALSAVAFVGFIGFGGETG